MATEAKVSEAKLAGVVEGDVLVGRNQFTGEFRFVTVKRIAAGTQGYELIICAMHDGGYAVTVSRMTAKTRNDEFMTDERWVKIASDIASVDAVRTEYTEALKTWKAPEAKASTPKKAVLVEQNTKLSAELEALRAKLDAMLAAQASATAAMGTTVSGFVAPTGDDAPAA